MSENHVSRSEFDNHMKHVRESLHEIRNYTMPIVQISEDIAVVKSEMNNVKNTIEKHSSKHEEIDKDITKIKTNHKWMASIFAFIQTLVVTWLGK